MLELKDICFNVRQDSKEKEILKNINLKIDERFVAITGPNGGGKSTLAKIIAGIEKPTSGKIILDGEDITDLSITDRANKGVSFAFHQCCIYALAALPIITNTAVMPYGISSFCAFFLITAGMLFGLNKIPDVIKNTGM